jgi:hypothetical protein
MLKDSEVKRRWPLCRGIVATPVMAAYSGTTAAPHEYFDHTGSGVLARVPLGRCTLSRDHF